MSGIVVIGVEREGGTVGDEETGYTPARDNVVWGNVLVDNCYPGLALKGWEGRPELILPDERIKSNLGNVSDYNVFYRTAKRGIPFWWNWGAMNCWTLKEWQEKTGNDKHSIVAEPLFKDAAAYDFHPADKSPAILFVRPPMTVTLDFDGKTGFLLGGVPVMNASPPTAAVLDKNMHSLRVEVSRSAKTMCFALGLLHPGHGAQMHCRITRQDGTVVELKWEAGKNIGPSLGRWDGKLAGDDKGVKTEVGWQSKDGLARVFLATWNNDNEWYPVKDVEWILDDDSAAVLIFGVTAK